MDSAITPTTRENLDRLLQELDHMNPDQFTEHQGNSTNSQDLLMPPMSSSSGLDLASPPVRGRSMSVCFGMPPMSSPNIHLRSANIPFHAPMPLPSASIHSAGLLDANGFPLPSPPMSPSLGGNDRAHIQIITNRRDTSFDLASDGGILLSPTALGRRSSVDALVRPHSVVNGIDDVSNYMQELESLSRVESHHSMLSSTSGLYPPAPPSYRSMSLPHVGMPGDDFSAFSSQMDNILQQSNSHLRYELNDSNMNDFNNCNNTSSMMFQPTYQMNMMNPSPLSGNDDYATQSYSLPMGAQAPPDVDILNGERLASPKKRGRRPKTQESQELSDNESSDSQETFKCNHPGCDRVFNRIQNLRSHARCHLESAPHVCQMCGHGFRRTTDLQRHYRTMHVPVDQKPWGCSGCGKRFGRSDALKRHMSSRSKIHGCPNGAVPQELVKQKMDEARQLKKMTQGKKKGKGLAEIRVPTPVSMEHVSSHASDYSTASFNPYAFNTQLPTAPMTAPGNPTFEHTLPLNTFSTFVI